MSGLAALAEDGGQVLVDRVDESVVSLRGAASRAARLAARLAHCHIAIRTSGAGARLVVLAIVASHQKALLPLYFACIEALD